MVSPTGGAGGFTPTPTNTGVDNSRPRSTSSSSESESGSLNGSVKLEGAVGGEPVTNSSSEFPPPHSSQARQRLMAAAADDSVMATTSSASDLTPPPADFAWFPPEERPAYELNRIPDARCFVFVALNNIYLLTQASTHEVVREHLQDFIKSGLWKNLLTALHTLTNVGGVTSKLVYRVCFHKLSGLMVTNWADQTDLTSSSTSTLTSGLTARLRLEFIKFQAAALVKLLQKIHKRSDLIDSNS